MASFYADEGKDLVFARFNCDRDVESSYLCEWLEVERYPTLKFIGYGDLHATNPLMRWLGRKPVAPRVATFNSDIEPETVRDWLEVMGGLSWWKRFRARVGSALGLTQHPTQVHDAARIQQLQEQLAGLEKENKDLLGRLGGGGTGGRGRGGGGGGSAGGAGAGAGGAGGDPMDDMIDALLAQPGMDEKMLDETLANLTDSMLGPVLAGGDPFRGLAQATFPADQTDFVLACIAEQTLLYCDGLKSQAAEPYCGIMEECIATDFEARGCLPAQCPLSKEGCAKLTQCTRSGVWEMYEKWLGLVMDELGDDSLVNTAAA
jgi:hypothetical protein